MLAGVTIATYVPPAQPTHTKHLIAHRLRQRLPGRQSTLSPTNPELPISSGIANSNTIAYFRILFFGVIIAITCSLLLHC